MKTMIRLTRMLCTRKITPIYINNKIISDANVATFKLLGENYSSDNNHVFYRTKIVKDANPVTFNVSPHHVGNADAEDATTKFNEGIKVED